MTEKPHHMTTQFLHSVDVHGDWGNGRLLDTTTGKSNTMEHT